MILRPETTSLAGTKAIGKARLIGIVKQYVPYRDVATSQQTSRARIVFEENSGLTSVITIDRINETVERERKRIMSRIKRMK